MYMCHRAGARFVWLRRAASASSSSSSALPEEEAAFELLQRLWSNDFAGAHVAIHEFTTRLRDQGENEEHVTLLLLPLLEALQTKLRDRALALLRKSYSSVHIRDATAMLGLVQGGHEADGQLQAMMDGMIERDNSRLCAYICSNNWHEKTPELWMGTPRRAASSFLCCNTRERRMYDEFAIINFIVLHTCVLTYKYVHAYMCAWVFFCSILTALFAAVVQREGWKFDESTGYVSINFTATPAADELSLSDDHLQQLVDYAVHLSRA